jgi:hypothetical protein
MKPKPRISLLLLALTMTGIATYACATKSYIDVNYRLPAATTDLQGQRLFLDSKDVRSAKTIFSDKAQAEFKNFTGLFSLSLSQGKHNVVIGAFDLPSLFKQAFIKRLENLGIDLIPEPEETTPALEIAIQVFQLDLDGGKWIANIRYEARLLKDGQTLFKETMSGNAERFKVFGQKDAEKVLGEIFTDIVNQLNIRKILEQAAG